MEVSWKIVFQYISLQWLRGTWMMMAYLHSRGLVWIRLTKIYYQHLRKDGIQRHRHFICHLTRWTLHWIICLLPTTPSHYGWFLGPRRGYDKRWCNWLCYLVFGSAFRGGKKKSSAYRGPYYKLEWMVESSMRYRVVNQLDVAERAYMMLTVGATIFADNTFSLVHARYMRLFRDLLACGRYSWG